MKSINNNGKILQMIENYCIDSGGKSFDKFIKKINYSSSFLNDFYLFQKACEYNNYEIFNYLFEKIFNINVYVQTFCKDGYLEICKYLFEIHRKKHKNIDYNELFVSACLSNNIEIVKYVFEKNIIFNKHDFYKKYFLDVCKNCNSEIINFVLDNVSYRCCHKIFDILCVNDCIDNMIYLYNKNKLSNYHMSSTIFENICRRNQIQIIIFVLKNIKYISYGNAFGIACLNSNIELIELLLKNGLPIDKKTINREFILACKNDRFDIVKIFLENYIGINVCIEKEYAFKKCCQEGNLEMAMMLKKYNPKINHHIDKDYCYNMAKNREILDWLESECHIIISNTKSARKIKF